MTLASIEYDFERMLIPLSRGPMIDDRNTTRQVLYHCRFPLLLGFLVEAGIEEHILSAISKVRQELVLMYIP